MAIPYEITDVTIGLLRKAGYTEDEIEKIKQRRSKELGGRREKEKRKAQNLFFESIRNKKGTQDVLFSRGNKAKSLEKNVGYLWLKNRYGEELANQILPASQPSELLIKFLDKEIQRLAQDLTCSIAVDIFENNYTKLGLNKNELKGIARNPPTARSFLRREMERYKYVLVRAGALRGEDPSKIACEFEKFRKLVEKIIHFGSASQISLDNLTPGVLRYVIKVWHYLTSYDVINCCLILERKTVPFRSKELEELKQKEEEKKKASAKGGKNKRLTQQSRQIQEATQYLTSINWITPAREAEEYNYWRRDHGLKTLSVTTARDHLKKAKEMHKKTE